MASHSRLSLLVAAAFVLGPLSPISAQTVLMKNPLAAVTVEDFKLDVQRVPEAQREGFLQSPQRISRVTENLMISKSLAALARKDKLDQDPAFEDRVRLQREKMLGEAYIARFDAQKAREFDARRGDFEKRALELYTIDKSKYALAERATVWHILARTEGKDPSEARRRIESALARIQKGEDFATVAREVTEDPGSAHKGGEFGPFLHAQVEKPFGDAAFALAKPGDVSPIVETRYGFHIIKLKERLPPRVASFEEVKPALMEQIRTQFLKDARDSLYRSFFEPPGFEADADAMRALQTHVDMSAPKPR